MAKSLEEIAREESLTNSNEIFSIMYENEKYWVKKARPTSSTKLHKFYYKLFPFEVLIPSQNKTAQETVTYETSKLDLFRSVGIYTPKVIYKCKEFFVLEDCGESIHSIIRNKYISEQEIYYYLDKVIQALAKIHNQNLFHGGAQTRNFTYKKSKMYVIDLEESFSEKIDIKVLQFRDLLLLLLSFVKIKASFDLDYTRMINTYIKLTHNTDVIKKLNILANKISFLIYLSEISWIDKLLGSDVKGFRQLFNILKKL